MHRKPAAVKAGSWYSQTRLLPVAACMSTTGTPPSPVSVYQMRALATSANVAGSGAAGEPAKRRAGETRQDPLLAEPGPEPLVEADGRRVPVEHGPLEAAAAAQ